MYKSCEVVDTILHILRVNVYICNIAYTLYVYMHYTACILCIYGKCVYILYSCIYTHSVYTHIILCCTVCIYIILYIPCMHILALYCIYDVHKYTCMVYKQYVLIFFFFFGHVHSMQRFLGQGSNVCHSRDNARSLTH